MKPEIIVSILWIIFGLIWLIARLRTKPTQERAPFTSRLLYGIPVLIGAYLMAVDNTALGRAVERFLPRSAGLDIAAIALTAAGIAFAVWARFYLGGNWSSAVSVKVDHQLVRTGPYAWVRHPIYSGILLAIFGTALARGKAVGFLGLAFFWLGFWIKSRMEEQFMRKTFGEQYEEYSRTTGALIPKLRDQS